MEISPDVLWLSLVIVFARILDVSIGILRVISVVRGQRALAAALGFVEALIWVFAIAKVTAHLDKPIYMFSFALGFALGNFIGLTLEKKFAYGKQVLRVFTRLGEEIATDLREREYKVTKFNGYGKHGPVDMLLLTLRRRQLPTVLQHIRALDEGSFYFVDEITSTSEVQQSSVFGPGFFKLKRK